MSYPFISVPREVYPKTFLKDVRLCLTFPKVEYAETLKGEVSAFFTSTYGVEIADLSSKNIIWSSDDSIRISFAFDSVSVTMRPPRYKSFELTEQILRDIVRYISIINGKSCAVKLELSKHNAIEYSLSNDKLDIRELMGSVYSEALMSNFSATELSSDVIGGLSRWEKSLMFEDKKGETAMTVVCGLNRESPSTRKGTLSLVTRIFSTAAGIPCDDIMNAAKKYNQDLDNAFHWSIRPEVVDLMRKKL